MDKTFPNSYSNIVIAGIHPPWDFNHKDICWEGSTELRKESRKGLDLEMNFLAQMPSRSNLTSQIPGYNGMTGCVKQGRRVDIKFGFSEVFMPSPTALWYKRLLNEFGLVLAVEPTGIY